MELAIFDLDNTLIAGDSDHAWGCFLIEKGLVDKHYYEQENDRFYEQYQQGILDIHEYQAFVLTPLMSIDSDTLRTLHQEFMASHIAPMRLAKADQLLQQHRDQDHTLLIITATNRFITTPIAKALRVDHLLATEPETINGEFTGRIAGIPCFQEGKIKRLEQWLEEHQMVPSKTHFYSDSINDAPLLAKVDKPTAVDPDTKLRDLARENNWPIISLR